MKLNSEQKKLIVFVLAWRTLLTFVTAYSTVFLKFRPDFAYTSLSSVASFSQLTKIIFLPWANFDGVHYIRIAAEGYIDQGRFLPFYPFILKLSNLLILNTRINDRFIVISSLVSVAIMVAAALVWQKILTNLYNQQTALYTLVAFFAFPTSFFLGAIYSESIFLLLSGIAFYLAMNKKWWQLIIPVSLLTITRLTGFVIIPAVAYWRWEEDKNYLPLKKFFSKKYFSKVISFKLKNWKWLAALVASIIPLLIYSYFNLVKWGDALFFVHAHGQLGNSRSTSSLVFPLITIYRYFKILLSLPPTLHEWRVALIELGSLFFMVLLWLVNLKQKTKMSLLLFTGLLMMVPTLSGTFSGFPRYSLVALPLFVALVRLKKSYFFTYVTICILLQIIFLAWFSTGYFIA